MGGSAFPIYELPTSDLPVLGDGTLADWEEVLPGPSATSVDCYQTAASFAR